MKKPFPFRIIAFIGLIILSASFLVKHFTHLPDFADGVMKGIAIGLLGIALIKQQHVKKSEVK